MTDISIPSNEGWYQDEELLALYATASEAPPFPFLEVGVYKGRSASVLSATFFPPLILCDNFALGNFKNLWPIHHTAYTDVREASGSVRAFGLVHHDADHSYEVVRDHLSVLMPKIVDHGFLCLHDYKDHSYPGVETGFFAAAHDSRTLWTPWRRAGHLQVFRKELTYE